MVGTIETRFTTDEQTQIEVARAARQLVGQEVFLGTTLFNYRGRLMGVTRRNTLLANVLTSTGDFSMIEAPIPIVNQIGDLRGIVRAGAMPSLEIERPRWYGIALEETNPLSAAEIKRIAGGRIGKTSVIETDLYNYIGQIKGLDDRYVYMQQIINLEQPYVMDFRVSMNLINDIGVVPAPFVL